MKKYLLFIALLWLLPAQSASSEQLLVVYPDRPPYNHTVDGKAVGILVKQTEKILADAKLTPEFKELPSLAILEEIQKEGSQVCSFGWFKTPERETFAKYTHPTFEDSPLVVLTLKENDRLFQGKTSLQDIAADKSLTLGVVEGFSYGRQADEILRDANVPRLAFRNRYQVCAMLALKRVSYMLTRPAEVSELIKQSGRGQEDFVSFSLPDVQDRSKRYIMCGKGVPDEVIARINASIPKFYTTCP